LGNLVWDRISFRDVGRDTVEEWGGISYAMEALSVALPEGWVMTPIVKVGEDLAEKAMEYLGTLPRVELHPGIQIVPFPNHRVQLRYQDQTRRLESLSGGVPGWTLAELQALDTDFDALYLNFITGFELTLETARGLRARFPVPLYADLHSLFQGVSPRGDRYPQELPGWSRWLRAFDAVQMNRNEFELLGRAEGDPWRLAAQVVGPELKLIAVTLGEEGAAYVAAPEFLPDPMCWAGARGRLSGGGATRTGKVILTETPRAGDPTGCGDVWGATFFASLLGGISLEEAMNAANRLATRNVEHRGARGLRHHLGGGLGP
jgi:hypothetical protein